MRWYGLVGIVISTLAIWSGMFFSAHWVKATELPYTLSDFLSLSNAFWNYMLLGIIESLSMALVFFCLQRAHIIWSVLCLVGAILAASWIAGSIVGVIQVQPFSYPVPIFLLAVWLGTFALNTALHILGITAQQPSGR
ncbi:MAG: hypothetical protein M1294_10290 [Firmicutes bacterium]|jgi:hypothetical protein|uniref:Uncharacterized protein n=1 Tax=Sulfobacillus benefaciens TaxID=453960 RepID=A0A2T2X739_9FIRM|nr:hypothetical protein [Bacillota bacterium]MCL5012657.1 hypothetical protein [Bacillota bacterium]PSR30320.1 MAG: hypothetical protein C7B43_06285 [Sulfobacillus benefaciens]